MVSLCPPGRRWLDVDVVLVRADEAVGAQGNLCRGGAKLASGLIHLLERHLLDEGDVLQLLEARVDVAGQQRAPKRPPGAVWPAHHRVDVAVEDGRDRVR